MTNPDPFIPFTKMAENPHTWQAKYNGYTATCIRIRRDDNLPIWRYRVIVTDPGGHEVANATTTNPEALHETRRILVEAADQPDPDEEDARQTAYWNAEAERQAPDSADRDAAVEWGGLDYPS